MKLPLGCPFQNKRGRGRERETERERKDKRMEGGKERKKRKEIKKEKRKEKRKEKKKKEGKKKERKGREGPTTPLFCGTEKPPPGSQEKRAPELSAPGQNALPRLPTMDPMGATPSIHPISGTSIQWPTSPFTILFSSPVHRGPSLLEPSDSLYLALDFTLSLHFLFPGRFHDYFFKKI